MTRAAALLVALSLACLAGCRNASTGLEQAGGTAQQRHEDAYRANNVGVAELELGNLDEAAAAFRRAISLDGTLAIPHLNLAIARLYAQDLTTAAAEANQAVRGMPDSPRPTYVLALVARADNRTDDAVRLFERVMQIDPADAGARVNLAQMHLQQGRYADVIALLRPVLRDEPYQVTAAYTLGLALTRSGAAAEGSRLLDRSQALRASGYGVVYGAGYLEQGRYAEGVVSTGAEPELVDRAAPPVTFTPTPLGGAARSGCLTALDADGDGTRDLVVADAAGVHTPQQRIRIPVSFPVAACLAGDYDNDGRADLLVMGTRAALFHNDGGGRFRDATASARLPPIAFAPGAAAFVDVDHDGDLDLAIASATGSLRLLRNNGNGTFADITRESQLDGIVGPVVAIVPTDFDDRRDVDLVMVYRDSPPRVLRNMRDGTFKDVTLETGLADVGGLKSGSGGGAITAVTAGDVNKDGFVDFFFGAAGSSVLALSDGHGRYTAGAVPEAVRAVASAQFIDYDNDGLLDMWIQPAEAAATRLYRNLGRTWADVSSQSIPAAAVSAGTAFSQLLIADLDRDGAEDVVQLAGTLTLWRNSGHRGNASLTVSLEGLGSNRLGIGSKVEMLAGALRSRIETSAATPAVAPIDIVFGLGPRRGADVARVLWPSGVLQTEINQSSTPGSLATLPPVVRVRELDRKPSSCPFLFTWNGERFEFVTDFLGAGEMGYWEGPGRWNVPDPIEYVRIDSRQLRAKDGVWPIRITNELEETLYLDRVQLLTVSHPSDVFVVPNEGMTEPPRPFKIHAIRDVRSVPRASDDRGRDVTDLVARIDRRAPGDFPLERFRGYAAPHALTFDIGAATRSSVLLLAAWTDYAFSSDNRAARQAGLTLSPPALEVRDARGRWRVLVADVGIPVGRPQTMAIELDGLRPNEHELRIVTNMQIHWDWVAVGTAARDVPIRVDRLDPTTAVLRERGFSREIQAGDVGPLVYDYAQVLPQAPWKVMPGRYTRAGDVVGLLTGADDRFVIAKPGDEIALEFSATGVRPDPPGWTRTFLLAGDGFSKEMDVNSASPDLVAPLPFHAMTRYPYAWPEQYPATPVHRRYEEHDNTRVVRRSLAPLELSLRSGR